MTDANSKNKDRKGQEASEPTINKAAELGQLLRGCREKAGLTIDRVAASTRISHPFIEALESGDLKKLPAEVFGRGFIRNLCKLYNEDPEPMLAVFDEALKGDQRPRHASDSLQPSVQQNSSAFPSIGLQKWIGFSSFLQRIKITPYSLIISVLAVLLIASIFYIASSRKNLLQSVSSTSKSLFKKSLSTSVDKASPINKVVSPAEVERQAIAHVETVETPDLDEETQHVANEMEKSSLAPDGNWIELQVKQRVQVMIDQDGQGWNNETLEPESYQYRFNDVLKVVLANPESVDISFNGKPLVQAGQGERTRRLTFRSGSFEDIKTN